MVTNYPRRLLLLEVPREVRLDKSNSLDECALAADVPCFVHLEKEQRVREQQMDHCLPDLQTGTLVAAVGGPVYGARAKLRAKVLTDLGKVHRHPRERLVSENLEPEAMLLLLRPSCLGVD